MSGKLVGEVLAASGALRERGLSARAFYALIAIAEKAGADDHAAFVRWDHIRAGLYGASKRTAERAVQELRTAGLIRLVRPGFRNEHRSSSPRYEVLPLPDADTQVAVSSGTDPDTQVSASTDPDTDKLGVDTDKSGVGYRHLGVVLDGHLDGHLDGGLADDLGSEPRCPEHSDPSLHPKPPKCHDCRRIREQREEADASRLRRDESARAAIRQAIDRCRDCDDYGRLVFDANTDCPKHLNFRTAGASS